MLELQRRRQAVERIHAATASIELERRTVELEQQVQWHQEHQYLAKAYTLGLQPAELLEQRRQEQERIYNAAQSRAAFWSPLSAMTTTINTAVTKTKTPISFTTDVNALALAMGQEQIQIGNEKQKSKKRRRRTYDKEEYSATSDEQKKRLIEAQTGFS